MDGSKSCLKDCLQKQKMLICKCNFFTISSDDGASFGVEMVIWIRFQQLSSGIFSKYYVPQINV